MALLRAITTVGGYTGVSRVLGFIRDILIAAALGAGPVADAFFVAFKFPNFFRRLFAEGAFAAGFVPLFAGELASEGDESAIRFAEEALSVLFFTLLVFVLLVEVAAPWLVYVLAPGFADEPYKYSLAVEFVRITFPYLLFIALVSLQGGILNSLDRFAAQAATPILLNLCMIGAILAYGPLGNDPGFPTAGHALAWGVAAAGFVQFAFLYIACRRAGVWLRLVRPRLTPMVKTLLKRILPVALGAGVYQVSLVIDIVIASLLPTGAISYLYYADRVTQLPLGVVGVAIGTALLPLLSRHWREGAEPAALHSQNRAMEFAVLLTLPAALALIVLADPLIAVLFQRGAFGPEQTVATARALAAFACGLPAFVMIKVLAPAFFARGDTATPVKIGLLAVSVNLVLNLALMIPLAHVGIALATTLSSWLNAGLLARALTRRGQFAADERLKTRVPRIAAAAVVMAAAVLALDFAAAPWLAGSEPERIAALAALVAAGLAVFAAAAHVLGAARWGELRRGFAAPDA